MGLEIWNRSYFARNYETIQQNIPEFNRLEVERMRSIHITLYYRSLRKVDMKKLSLDPQVKIHAVIFDIKIKHAQQQI